MGQIKEVTLDFGFKSTSEKKKEVGKPKSGGSAVHRLSESSFSVRPQSQEKARSSRSDKGGIKLDTGTCPSGGGSHRSKGDDVSNKKSEMKISSKKASSGSHRSRSNDDCNNKSEKKMSSKKTSPGSSIKKFGEMSSGGASDSRQLKRKIDEMSSNKSSRLEVDQNTFKVPKLAPAKLLSSKTDLNLKGKNNIKDLPKSSDATKKKRDSAQKESELAVEYTEVQQICADKNCKKPQDENVDWLACDRCHQWFHNKCVSVDPKMARNEDFEYYCSSCEIKCSNKSKNHQESEKHRKSTKEFAESKMNKCFNSTPVRSNNISTNASDIPVSDKKISVTNPLKKQKSDANEMNTIANTIQKLPLSLTMPCSISISHLSWKLQKSLGRTMKEDIEKQSENKPLTEPSFVFTTEPREIGSSIEQSTESSLEQKTENSTPAEHLTFTKIGPHWEFSDEKCTLEETFQNVKNVVPISPLKTPEQREIGKEKKTKRNKAEIFCKNQSAEPVTVGPKWPFPAEDFILKRLPSEVTRNYRPLTVGPKWGFSDEEFELDNSEIFEKIKELRWGPIMESNAYEALRLGQTNQKKMIPASSLKTLKQRAIEKAKEMEAKRIEKSKEREAEKIKEAKERESKRNEEVKERKANTSYLTDFLGIDFIPNKVSVKVTEEVKRRGPAKQSPFMKAVQERKRKMADANQSNCVQQTKMRKIGE